MPPRPRPVFLLPLVLLAAAAFALRAVDLDWGLPHVYEEATPVREAVEFWGEPGGGLDLNPHFFKYPSLTFYANFALQAGRYFGMSLAGSAASLNDFRQALDQDPAAVVLDGRRLQALFGALLVLPVFFLGRRLAGPVAGWTGAVVAAVLPAAVAESRLVGPDAALALFAACALAACARVADRGSRTDVLWAGLWMGLAASSKYPGALLVVPLVTALAVRARRGGEPVARAVLGLPLWEAAAVAVVAFAVTSPYVLLDPGAFLEDLRFEQRHMRLGHLGREEGLAWSWYLRDALPAGWTPAVLVAAPLGLLALLLDPARRRTALPGAAFAVVLLLVLGTWKMAAARYALPLAPLAAVWTGALVAQAAARIPAGAPRTAVAVAGALLVVAWPALRSAEAVGTADLRDSRTASREWILENTPDDATLLVEFYGPEFPGEERRAIKLPFHGVDTHRYDAVYAARLYGDFDYVVLSSGVGDRYRARPREYPRQMTFYATVEHAFREVARFPAGEYLGPTIRVLERRAGVPVAPITAIDDSFFGHLEGNRSVAEYLSRLGTVLVDAGRRENGFHLLRAAVDMDGDNAAVWGNLGAMQMRTGDYEGALRSLRRARDLDPADARVHINLGVLFAREGELSQSAGAYRAALERSPDNEEIYIGLARVLVEDVRYAEARLVLDEFLRRFPRSGRRADVETALAELRAMGPGRP